MGTKSGAPPRPLQTSRRAKLVPARTPARSLGEAVARFGADAKAKLSNPAATGQPEDQLRTPVDHLIQDLAELCMPMRTVTAVGESSLQQLKTRPDYAITCSNVLR